MPDDFDIKKIFTETESLIWNLYDKKRLSEEERNFLWKLLGLLRKSPQAENLLAVLLAWLDQSTSSPNDQIIKATLLAMNMDEQESIEFNLELIQELLPKSS